MLESLDDKTSDKVLSRVKSVGFAITVEQRKRIKFCGTRGQRELVEQR
jgi:hypothetical protein